MFKPSISSNERRAPRSASIEPTRPPSATVKFSEAALSRRASWRYSPRSEVASSSISSWALSTIRCASSRLIPSSLATSSAGVRRELRPPSNWPTRCRSTSISPRCTAMTIAMVSNCGASQVSPVFLFRTTQLPSYPRANDSGSMGAGASISKSSPATRSTCSGVGLLASQDSLLAVRRAWRFSPLVRPGLAPQSSGSGAASGIPPPIAIS